MFFEETKVIKVNGRQAVTYSPIGHYCESCGAEIYVGVEHIKTSSKNDRACSCRLPTVLAVGFGLVFAQLGKTHVQGSVGFLEGIKTCRIIARETSSSCTWGSITSMQV